MTDERIQGQGEVVQCPGCGEKVIKTLYCIKCGFPLYKHKTPEDSTGDL